MSNNADKALELIKFNADGLVPAIAQCHLTGRVLMMAWQNAEAVRESFATNRACYFSRSRNELWRKGDSSGHIQNLVDFRIDCDGDTVLMLVEQVGAACHTMRSDCFFSAIRDGDVVELSDPIEDA
ncbi:MAG: phosphoribosyl-AMP cyclohydrolase [Alphaproteobacteria bacterium]